MNYRWEYILTLSVGTHCAILNKDLKIHFYVPSIESLVFGSKRKCFSDKILELVSAGLICSNLYKMLSIPRGLTKIKRHDCSIPSSSVCVCVCV